MTNDLSAHLSNSGYTKIGLRRNGVGQLLADVEIGAEHVSMILDSGASATVLDKESADRLGLSRAEAERCGVGAGGQVDTFAIESVSLSLGGIDVPLGPLPVMDFSHVNDRLTAVGEARVDGVLGADILNRHNAIFEYAAPAVYLLRPL